MPSRVGSSLTNTDPNARVRVTASFANRFYEPIVLLDVLNAKCEKKPHTDSDPPANLARSEQNFQAFVNKLARLCDTEKGGDTVTAFTVLKHPDHIEYRFTSNQRGKDGFIRARDFITSILHILGNMEEHEKKSVVSSILRKSVSFGRPRVTLYVKELESGSVSCISACETENTDESRSILKKLKELDERLRVFNNKRLGEDEYAKGCENLIKSIDQLHQSEVYELIHKRTKEGRIDESESWSGLRHAAGRLVSYLLDARFLVSMPKRWPELFDNPDVCYVPSSVIDTCPFRGKHSPNKMTADGIVGRMTSNSKKIEQFRDHAQQLQSIELDRRLQNKAKDLRPIVHAEVLLLESLENGCGTHHSMFFNGYRYIGSSKPTCRLCSYYFLEHPSGVEVRRTHHNLYAAWRMPDVHGRQGPKAEKDMEKLMNKVLALVRRDAFRVMEEKFSEGKLHDSNTETSYPRWSASGKTNANIEGVTSILGNLEVNSSDELNSSDEVNFSDQQEEVSSATYTEKGLFVDGGEEVTSSITDRGSFDADEEATSSITEIGSFEGGEQVASSILETGSFDAGNESTDEVDCGEDGGVKLW